MTINYYLCFMDKHQIGETIKRYRKQRKFTQLQIAELAKDTRQQIVNLEGGKRNISLDRLIKILRVIGLTIEIMPIEGTLKQSEVTLKETNKNTTTSLKTTSKG